MIQGELELRRIDSVSEILPIHAPVVVNITAWEECKCIVCRIYRCEGLALSACATVFGAFIFTVHILSNIRS